MSRTRRIPGVAIATMVALALAGCAPGPHQPSSTDGPVPTAAPGSLPIPSARFAETCSELGSKAAFDDYLTGDIDQVLDEASPPTTLATAAMRTAGALNCRWESGSENFGYPDEYISIVARPDATTGFTDVRQMYVEDGYTVFDTVGDRSVRFCFSGEDDWSCNGEMLVGSTWLTVQINADTPDGGPLADDLVEQRMENAMERAADNIGPAADPGWELPTGAFTGDSFCVGKAKAYLKEALGFAKPFQFGYDALFTDYWVFDRTNSTECGWADKKDFDLGTIRFATLPGSAWWAGGWAQNPPRVFGDPSELVVIEGLGDTYIRCEKSSCLVNLLVEGSAMEIFTIDVSRARLIAALERLPALLAEEGSGA